MHARTLEVLDELGTAQALIARGVPITKFVVRDGSRRLLTVPFRGLPTPYPYTLMVPQCETEAFCWTGSGHSATMCTVRTRWRQSFRIRMA